jgi:hypothetical protein
VEGGTIDGLGLARPKALSGEGEVPSSGFAIRRPPNDCERLKSPSMATRPWRPCENSMSGEKWEDVKESRFRSSREISRLELGLATVEGSGGIDWLRLAGGSGPLSSPPSGALAALL